MDWIDCKETNGSVFGSLLLGSSGVLCRIYKNDKDELAENWDGEWSALINSYPKCTCPPVLISKDLNELKTKVEELINTFSN